MAFENDRILSRLLGSLYTEVFQRKTADPNKPINRASHLIQEQLVLDDTKTRFAPTTNAIHQWGPGGTGDETPLGPTLLSARWSFTATWG